MTNQVNKYDKINILLFIFLIAVILVFFAIAVYLPVYIAVNNYLLT